MTDHHQANTESSGESADDTDPLLVRPWISGGPSATRWDAHAGRPARRAPAHRAVASPIALPGAAAPAGTGPRNRRRWVIAAAIGLFAVAALTMAGYAALRPDDGTPPAAAPAVSRPPLSSIAPSPSPSPTGGPATVAELAPITPPARSVPSRRPATDRPPAPSRTPASATPPAGVAPELAVPPTARTGVILGPGGRCLDLNGGVAADGNHIQMFDCNGTDAQKWTFGPDGTLRVQGQCAQETSDATVHITGCDTRASEQWRSGPDGAVVNLSSGRCLTDPDDGAADFTRVTVTLCTGGDQTQRRTLP